jgi:hypothetical protein
MAEEQQLEKLEQRVGVLESTLTDRETKITALEAEMKSLVVSGAPAPAAAAPAAAAAAPAPAAGGGAGADLAAQIATKGEEIRTMKAAKAGKDEVMAVVKAMNDLKSQFQAITGSAYAPPGGAPAPAAASKKKGKGGAAAPAPAAEAPLDPEIERKFAIIRSVGEECVTDADLRKLLVNKPAFNLYDGFEPSGRMHIAQVRTGKHACPVGWGWGGRGSEPGLHQWEGMLQRANPC